MGFRSFIQKGLGLAGKTAMRYADSMSGGLASKIVDKTVGLANQHAGLIGKVANTVGKHFLSDETRNKLSSLADQAVRYIPKGTVRTALKRINNAAQGRDVDYKISKHSRKKAEKAVKAAEKIDLSSSKPVIKPKATSKSTTSEGITQSAPKSAPKFTSKYADNGGEVFV